MANIKDSQKGFQLPEKFKSLDDDKIQKKVSELEVEISEAMTDISSQQQDLGHLKRYLREQGSVCEHKKLTKTGEKSYRCDECKSNMIVKVIF